MWKRKTPSGVLLIKALQMEVQVANKMSEMMSVQFRKYNGDCNPKKVVLSGLSFFLLLILIL